MRQVLIRFFGHVNEHGVPVGGLPIYGYGLMLFLGFVCCTWWACRRARREGIESDNMLDLALWAFVGGIVGARVFYVIQKGLIQQTGEIRSLLDVFAIWQGGLVYYGGLIGGVTGFFWLVHRRRWNKWQYLDLIVPPVALGLAFGRAGCFLNGCCYGDYCQLPWAITFPGPSAAQPMGSIPYASQVWAGWISHGSAMLHLHPTQLYSLLNAVLLAALAAAFYRVRRRDGETTAYLLIVYPITRFLLEVVRNDEGGIAFTGLTISQNASLLVCVFGCLLLKRLRKRPAQYPPGGPGLGGERL
jgi:phosphatidylglycerol---prolipoprotein diacylglyceryl transferase